MKRRYLIEGSVLMISLVLLIVLTLLALTSIDNTIMEEKMVGNLYQENLAFQAAETGLREGEAWLLSLNKNTRPDPTNDGSSQVWTVHAPYAANLGLASDVPPVDWFEEWEVTDWQTAANNSTVFSVTAQNAQSYYLIEYLYNICDSVAIGQQADQKSCEDYYQVTSLGLGPGDRIKVLIRSILSRKY